MVHGLQLIDTCHRHVADDMVHCQGSLSSDRSKTHLFFEENFLNSIIHMF